MTGNLVPIVEPRFGGGPRLAAQTQLAKVDIASSPSIFRSSAAPPATAGCRA